MNWIRKLIAMGTGAAAICALMAFVVAPAVLAHGPDRVRGQAAAEQTAAPEAAPSQACLDARQLIVTARKDDRGEDMSEKLAAGQPGADPTKDVNEDQIERAAMEALWVKARSACAEQPEPAKTTGASAPAATQGCEAAKTALKNALVQEKAHEMSEKGTPTEHSAADTQEDQAEFAAIKSLWQQAAAACGFSSEHFEHSR
jgi:hypothetical protein